VKQQPLDSQSNALPVVPLHLPTSDWQLLIIKVKQTSWDSYVIFTAAYSTVRNLSPRCCSHVVTVSEIISLLPLTKIYSILKVICSYARHTSLTNTHNTHNHFTALWILSGITNTRKVKPIWILLNQEIVSGSGISWAIWKSALHPTGNHTSTPPAPHHSVFYRPDALPTTQQTASKQWQWPRWESITISTEWHQQFLRWQKRIHNFLSTAAS